jgi:extracellular factor (EF) 3-hydroxypalmitic acid methyl ester biosynthesis protein
MSYAALDIFEQLRPDDIHWMLASSELRAIPANAVLVREDDPSDTIFFIADGLFEVYVFDGSANRTQVGRLGPGEIIGEISWLDRKPISATVRALEPSTVMALGVIALERKLAADAGFAARLFRAIATLTAERLRTTTSQVRRAELSSSPQTASGGVVDAIASLKRLVVASGATTAGIPEHAAKDIGKAFTAVAQGIDGDGTQGAGKIADAIANDLLPLLALSATAERCRTRPRGYAGDYQTLDMIYANKPAGKGPAGLVLDACVLELPAAKAIRNRRRLIAGEIAKAYAGAAKELHVTSLACGPAAEIFDAFAQAGDKSRLIATCIDIDKEALAQVTARAEKEKIAAQIGTVPGNLIYLATGRQELDLPSQDLIYSLNLTDYFGDELAVSLLSWVHERLRPGGRVILGNFHPRNPNRGLMEQALGWRIVHRDEAGMNQLFAASRFAKPATRVTFEDEGIYLLAECTK